MQMPPPRKYTTTTTCSGMHHVAALLACTCCYVQLIDFGFSKHLESVATLGVGTPDYMPRELHSIARSACDIASHIYLCCIVVLLQLIDFGLSKHLESVAILSVGMPN
jgi:serine/threonine protein kinase